MCFDPNYTLEYQLNAFNNVMEWFDEIWDFSPSSCALSYFAGFEEVEDSDKEAISRNTRGRSLEALYLQPGSPVFPSPTSGLSKDNLEQSGLDPDRVILCAVCKDAVRFFSCPELGQKIYRTFGK
jgi:hypothetical protein